MGRWASHSLNDADTGNGCRRPRYRTILSLNAGSLSLGRCILLGNNSLLLQRLFGSWSGQVVRVVRVVGYLVCAGRPRSVVAGAQLGLGAGGLDVAPLSVGNLWRRPLPR